MEVCELARLGADEIGEIEAVAARMARNLAADFSALSYRADGRSLLGGPVALILIRRIRQLRSMFRARNRRRAITVPTAIDEIDVGHCQFVVQGGQFFYPIWSGPLEPDSLRLLI